MRVNGEELSLVAGETVADLLAREDYDAPKVVVELNGIILKKEQLSSTYLKEEDVVEIISFMGGG
ncbi:MAG: sulfur carrier protein ThiS [Lachnospiraceae bacterium]